MLRVSVRRSVTSVGLVTSPCVRCVTSAVTGAACFSEEICDLSRAGNLTMCPLCDQHCD